MRCEYCLSKSQEGEICGRCGAPLNGGSQVKNTLEILKSEPFFYNGYICYSLHDQVNDTVEVQFWLGHDLIERIMVNRDILKYHVPENFDSMAFFWDLFLLAQGEKEVLEIKEKNSVYPATFEVRRVENPEKERYFGLSLRQLMEESRKASYR